MSLNGKVMAYRAHRATRTTVCSLSISRRGTTFPTSFGTLPAIAFISLPMPTSGRPASWHLPSRQQNSRPPRSYHRLGEVCEGSEDFAPNDLLLKQSKNEMFGVSVGTTADHQFVTLRHGSKTENEVFVIDVNDDEKRLVNLLPMVDDVEYSVAKSGPYWFLRTKAGCAKDHFRVERGEWADKATKQELRWTAHVAEKKGYALEGMRTTKDYLLLSYLDVATGVPKLVVRHAAHAQADLDPDEPFPAHLPTSRPTASSSPSGIADPRRSPTATFSPRPTTPSTESSSCSILPHSPPRGTTGSGRPAVTAMLRYQARRSRTMRSRSTTPALLARWRGQRTGAARDAA